MGLRGALMEAMLLLTDPEKVADWAETDANFMWLCALHHRGYGGAHHASFADFYGALYVQNLLSK